MKKVSRSELIESICKKFNLPSNKITDNYFTREQLIELNLTAEKMLEIITDQTNLTDAIKEGRKNNGSSKS